MQENSSSSFPLSAAQPGLGRFAWLRRALIWLFWIGYFGFALIILALRYWALPNIEHYRGDIERGISQAVGLPVKIDHIDTRWNGLRPHLSLRGFSIQDAAGRPGLAFDTVETELSWASLWHWQLRLYRLEIDAPALHIRREKGGHIFIAGIEFDPEAENTAFVDWLLRQERVVIRDASINWEDAQRDAPPLALSKLNLVLQNDGRRHRFGLTAVPPPALAARLDVRGDLRSAHPERLETWTGQAYAELDYADLAVWRNWVDYPVDLPQGAGGMRLWLGFGDGRLDTLAADIALRDVRLKLAADLPMLDLTDLAGHIAARLPKNGFEVSSRQLALATREGVRLAPTDFSLRWTPAAGGKPASGALSANGLDLDALTRLAGFLPLDAVTRKRLTDYTPRGRVTDLKLGWTGEPGALSAFNAQAHFEGLGVRAQDHWPGFSGLTGSLDGNEKGGHLTLNSRRAALDLPMVFANPLLELERLNAKASWTMADGRVDMQLQEAAFENKDAAGSAAGHYRSSHDGPGEIDLTAHLSRADGTAVWRYMPLVVNPDVPAWLRAAITKGRASEAVLNLKGDLKDFPFADGKKGTFRVAAKIAGATLRYGADWPGIDNIDGDLLFEGTRMRIRASKGNTYGVTVSGVSAEIADLRSLEEILSVTGNAAGPTADFLRFIDTSPVFGYIDGFTEGMRATGNGTLGLKLTLPLRKLERAKIEGDYQFLRNELKVDTDLPPLTEVNGRLQFTGAGVTMKGARAQLLGSPLTIDVATRDDGAVAINTQGNLNIANIRKSMDHPLLGHLSGSAAWRGAVVVKKHSADVKLESNLQGIASSLPEPFNKTAISVMPFTFQRSAAAPGVAGTTAGVVSVARDQVRVSLGSGLNAQLVRRHDGGRTTVERGLIGIGAPPAQPEKDAGKGIAVAVNMPALNIDFWRRLFAGADGGASKSGGGYPVTQVSLRTDELIAFDRHFHDVKLRATLGSDTWKAQVTSRDATGDLTWRANDRGRLQARLKQLTLNETQPGNAMVAEAPLRELPGIDLVAENFTLGERKLGRLELLASNAGAAWKMERLALTNPDGALTADGVWSGGATQLDFKLDVTDIGNLLTRVGYGDVVKRGTAKLEGKVSWTGAPVEIDNASLQGTLKVEAARGQFNKLEPGMGRLLGILSLQSLPRRITLDFRDVFSEGFAFDKIAGDAKVARGIISTQNLQIEGPAAKILMKGEANIPAETQDVRVRIQPALSDAVAIGVAIANPAVGVGTWVAQKILKDPFGQMFAYEYAITGAWSDPKVEKIQRPAANENANGDANGNGRTAP